MTHQYHLKSNFVLLQTLLKPALGECEREDRSSQVATSSNKASNFGSPETHARMAPHRYLSNYHVTRSLRPTVPQVHSKCTGNESGDADLLCNVRQYFVFDV